MCCKVTRVPELNKPEKKMCNHCDGGCTIYDDRPKSCMDFKCAWLSGDLGDDMRPDKVGFMVEVLPYSSVVFVTSINDNTLIDMEQSFGPYINGGVSVVASNGYALIAKGATADSVRSAVISSARFMGVI